MTGLLPVMVPVAAFLTWGIWISTPGYLARVRAGERRRELDLERVKAENDIAIETARWQAEIARDDFNRTRARMHAEADNDPESPLRRIM